jgi:5'-3' exonuclease
MADNHTRCPTCGIRGIEVAQALLMETPTRHASNAGNVAVIWVGDRDSC